MYRSTTSGSARSFRGPPAGRGGLYVRSCRAVVPREQYAKWEYQDGQMPRLAAVRRSTRFPVGKQVAARHSTDQRGPWLHRRALEPPALALRQPAPDAEPLIVLEGVLQALGANLTAAADLLCFPGGATLLREKRLRIGLRTQRAILPAQFSGIVNVDVETVVHQRDDDLRHCAPPAPSR